MRSCELLEEYIFRLAATVFRTTGLEQACARPASVAEAVQRAGLAPETALVPASWVLRTLAAGGRVERMPDDRYRADPDLTLPDASVIADEQSRLDPRCLPSYRIAALAADEYPAVLQGSIAGEDALFTPDHIGTWIEYFSNANPMYAIANAVGSLAAEQALPTRAAHVLELGGGLGSGAEALLARLESLGQTNRLDTYVFTDIVPPFLRRAKKALTARFPAVPLQFSWMDIDQPFAKAGIVPATCSLVYAVNVLHVARDLGATLAQLREALVPGGALVLAECVRPFADRPLHVEFVFNLLDAFRAPMLVPAWRPNGGFLTPEQWTAALQANGFGSIADPARHRRPARRLSFIPGGSDHRPANVSIACDLEVPDVWFEGHFPGNPILPGVAQLALVLDALSQESDAELALTGIPFVRLRQLVRPGDRLRLTAEPRSNATWRFAITCAGTTVTNGELCFGPPETPRPAAPAWPMVADAPPLAWLLPHQPPMRFVTQALAESAEGLRGAARIPGDCPLAGNGVAPVLAAIEAAAQTSALWEATRRLRAGPGTGPRLGYLVGLRDVTLARPPHAHGYEFRRDRDAQGALAAPGALRDRGRPRRCVHPGGNHVRVPHRHRGAALVPAAPPCLSRSASLHSDRSVGTATARAERKPDAAIRPGPVTPATMLPLPPSCPLPALSTGGAAP